MKSRMISDEFKLRIGDRGFNNEIGSFIKDKSLEYLGQAGKKRNWTG